MIKNIFIHPLYKMDKIIDTQQDILLVNTNGDENYKFILTLLSKLNKNEYDSTLSIFIDEKYKNSFENLGFDINSIRSLRNGLNRKSTKKIILVIDYNEYYHNDQDAFKTISKPHKEVYKIVLYSPTNSPTNGMEILRNGMGDEILYIDNNVVYSANPKYILDPKYIPDPRFVEPEKKSFWWW
jgi:hypothetical protein